MSLPGNTRVARQDAPYHAAPDEQQDEGDHKLPRAAVEQAADQQVRQPAEGEARGPDGDRVGRPDQPDTQPAEDPDGRGDRDPPTDTTRHSEETEDQDRHGVAE